MAFVKFPEPTQRAVDFTSSGSWTCPSGVYVAEFMVVGAGGGGGGTDNSVNTRGAGGGGGGGGAVKVVNLPVTPNSVYTITIGAKGTGGAIGAAGSNGGFSEVLLSGTSLIKSYGGSGGSGVSNTDLAVLPTSTRTMAGGGGLAGSATSATARGGGGGGALPTSYYTASMGLNSSLALSEGSPGFQQAGASTTFGTGGFMGYGAGGGGGSGVQTTASLTAQGGASAFAGVGGNGSSVTVATDIAGGNAVDKTGCGGGGAYSGLSTTGAAGGNGADGLVRIKYYG